MNCGLGSLAGTSRAKQRAPALKRISGLGPTYVVSGYRFDPVVL